MTYGTNPPCAICQRRKGYQISPGGTMYPPTESIPPFTGRQFLTDDKTPPSRTGECWNYEPSCAVHAHEIIEAEWAATLSAREVNRGIRS